MPDDKPQATTTAQTASPSDPTPTPIPHGDSGSDGQHPIAHDSTDEQSGAAEHFPVPRLRLHLDALGHAGTAAFQAATTSATKTKKPTTVLTLLQRCIGNVQHWLYGTASTARAKSRPTRSVTLKLRDMGGVAYTTSNELDEEHREIHLSASYLVSEPVAPRRAAEITGVLTHEIVHCFQWDGKGTAPSGLIEGIADWVRLNCGLAPPHWKREAPAKWDAGYEITAYFLQYLEERIGKGTVRRINEKLRLHKYQEKEFWTELVGRPVEQLWEDYRKKLKEEKEKEKGEKGEKAAANVDKDDQYSAEQAAT